MAEREFMQKFYEYLVSTYPDDNNIKQWFQEYSNKFCPKPVFKRTRSVVKKELKTKLLDSYSEDRRIISDVDINTETVEKCIESIKTLEQSIQSHKRDIIYKSALEGQIIYHLKQFKKGQTGVFLAQQGIKFSISYCNSLVRLYKLVIIYPNLQKCSIDLGVIMKNMKVVEEICKEFNW